jgi:hypothetical protein
MIARSRNRGESLLKIDWEFKTSTPLDDSKKNIASGYWDSNLFSNISRI